jgi:hypothetical protein
LIRAAIQGIDAIREVCPEARMVNVDPLCHVVPPQTRPDLIAGARDFNQRAVYEAWDMLCGRFLPELGGSRRHLDIIGINYYWSSQWQIGREDSPLPEDDPRRLPLRQLVTEAWQRYGGDLLITETSHVGPKRGPWIDEISEEVVALHTAGIPLEGVCIYPILGMPEWHQRRRWTQMGLWDVIQTSGELPRQLYQPMLHALERATTRIERARPPRPSSPAVAGSSLLFAGHTTTPLPVLQSAPSGNDVNPQ